MRAKTVQIAWHDKSPVNSVDFHPDGFFVTAGADNEIRAWRLTRDAEGNPSINFLDSWEHHSKAVNCVRFSPSGDTLASAGDAGEIVLWQQPGVPAKRASLDPAAAGDGFAWKPVCNLRGTVADVFDLAWAPDGTALVAGAIDNESMLFDVGARKSVSRFSDHKHYVQGVAWDPLDQFVVTQSADRTCRVYAHKPAAAGKKGERQAQACAAARVKGLVPSATLAKLALPTSPAKQPEAVLTGTAAPDGAAPGKPPKAPSVHLFRNESDILVRRLAWSPDGAFLVAPAGLYQADADSKPCNTAYIYARGNWACPVAHLPSYNKGAPVAVRFCPVLYKRAAEVQAADREQATAGPFAGLPYRLVFAVATPDSVLVYDTESLEPRILLGSMHYSTIMDLAWSPDGAALVVSSRDGYCSVATFQPGELGEALPAEEVPAGLGSWLQRARSVPAPRPGGSAAGRPALGAGKAAATAAAGQPAAALQQQPTEVAQEQPQPQQAASVPAAQQGAAAGPPGRRIAPQALPAGSVVAKPLVQRVQAEAVAPLGGNSTAAAVGGASTAGVPAPKRIRPEAVQTPPVTVFGGSPAAGVVSVPKQRIAPVRVAEQGAADKQPSPAAAAADAAGASEESSRPARAAAAKPASKGFSLAALAKQAGMAAAKRPAAGAADRGSDDRAASKRAKGGS